MTLLCVGKADLTETENFMDNAKNKYKCLTNISHNGKTYAASVFIELTPVEAEVLLLSKAIEPVEGNAGLQNEMDAEELIKKQFETIELLDQELTASKKDLLTANTTINTLRADLNDANQKITAMSKELGVLKTESEKTVDAAPAPESKSKAKSGK